MSIRRAVKNVSNNYAPCERDVREATSNDRKLATVAVMARVANATYDATASPLVMAMLWKRLNDMGKNWRHVYKGLLLLEYILKTGADHIVGEVLKNKFAIQTLLDFRYVDSRGVDKGMNVREQAKQMMKWLDAPEELQAERERSTSQHRRLTQTMGKKAEAKPVHPSRASTMAKKSTIMPNGDVPPDPREEELRQIRRAQEFSYVEYQASSPQAAGPAPTSPLQAGGTEEEQLAYALQLSALEAQQSPPPRMQSPQEQEAEALAEREEEELAMALSLSLAEVQDASRVLNSDDESDAESITPPNSPYQGDLFDIGAPLDGLPSYDESVDSASDAGLVANDEVDTDSERADSVSDVPAELQGATHDELQAYLEADASFGESDLSGQYHNPDNPFN